MRKLRINFFAEYAGVMIQVAVWHSKLKIGDYQILFCQKQKYYFHFFKRNLKLDCIFDNLTFIYFKSGYFL